VEGVEGEGWRGFGRGGGVGLIGWEVGGEEWGGGREIVTQPLLMGVFRGSYCQRCLNGRLTRNSKYGEGWLHFEGGQSLKNWDICKARSGSPSTRNAEGQARLFQYCKYRRQSEGIQARSRTKTKTIHFGEEWLRGGCGSGGSQGGGQTRGRIKGTMVVNGIFCWGS